ncbi:terminase small subunit [Escherichia sp. KTE11]|nr:terminase small subunit [Escherichia sp. KTE11]
MLKTNFWASVVSFLCFCPWNEQWKSTKSSWLTFSARVSVPFRTGRSRECPFCGGGGKGNEVLYDSAAAIKWYAERDAEIENEKLRREVEELRQASETDLQPGTIEYERHRLTRAQADAQELKNARDSAEVVETAFCTFVLSRIAGEIASILDGIPLSVQRRFPELENRHVDFLKRDIIKAMNKAAALDELIPGLLSEYIEQSG